MLVWVQPRQTEGAASGQGSAPCEWWGPGAVLSGGRSYTSSSRVPAKPSGAGPLQPSPPAAGSPREGGPEGGGGYQEEEWAPGEAGGEPGVCRPWRRFAPRSLSLGEEKCILLSTCGCTGSVTHPPCVLSWDPSWAPVFSPRGPSTKAFPGARGRAGPQVGIWWHQARWVCSVGRGPHEKLNLSRGVGPPALTGSRRGM